MPLGFEVLGPLRVRGEDGEVPLERPSHRRLLAILLLDADRRLSSDTLIDRFWGEEAPSSAKGALQTHISALRRLLTPELIVTEGYGYRLDLAGHHLDAARLEVLVEDTREALAAHRWEEALDAASAALTLWRGSPYQELADDDFARPEITRLQELHLEVGEAKAAALLELGRSEEALADLERLVAQHPLRERLWEQLVTARYRLGRPAEALAAYREAEQVLAELGLEPGPELRRLEEEVLIHHPRLAPRRRRHNLPAALSSFVGRHRELTEVGKLLTEHRLVTLTVVGGSGKTRLALEAARSEVDVLPDGCWLVELAGLRDPQLVAWEVTVGLGLRPQGGDVLTLLRRVVEGQRLLVLLDNCEHLLEAAAEVAHTLLEAAEGVQVLATSRQPLGVPGEAVYRVAPLAVPPPQTPSEELRSFDAVRLFEERAALSLPGFSLHAGNGEAVAEICRRLDGVPLALELAAARVAALPPEALAASLDDRFHTLGERSSGPPRQRTLAATVDWSYQLLTPAEQQLFARLGVFRGSFDLEMAAEVCGDGELDGAEVPGRLAGLCEQSLVTTQEGPGGRRYRLLETLRVYAEQRLEEAGEAERWRRRHAEAYARLAEDLHRRFRTPAQLEAFTRFRVEHDNLRAALHWAQERGEAELGLRITAALMPLWTMAGFLPEAWRWLEGLPVDDERLPAELRPRVLLEGVIPAISLDPHRAVELASRGVELARQVLDQPALLALGLAWEEWARSYMDTAWTPPPSQQALEVAEESGDPWVVAMVQSILGLVAGEAGMEEGVEMVAAGAEGLRKLGDRIQEAWSLWWVADASYCVGRLAEAVEACERAMAAGARVQAEAVTVHAKALKGRVLLAMGDPAAREVLREALEETTRQDDRWCMALNQRQLALAEMEHDPQQAAKLLGESLAISGELGLDWNVVHLAGFVAKLAARHGDLGLAATLFAFQAKNTPTNRLVEAGRRFLEEQRRRLREPELSEVRRRLPPAELQTAEDRGRSLDRGEAAELMQQWLASRWMVPTPG